jgi:hypothetical protein
VLTIVSSYLAKKVEFNQVFLSLVEVWDIPHHKYRRVGYEWVKFSDHKLNSSQSGWI